jgi:hypothetical protein
VGGFRETGAGAMVSRGRTVRCVDAYSIPLNSSIDWFNNDYLRKYILKSNTIHIFIFVYFSF